MLENLLSSLIGTGSQQEIRLDQLSLLKRPSKKIRLRICLVLAGAYFISAGMDFFFSNQVLTLPNLLMGVACLIPVFGILFADWKDRFTWRVGVIFFWVAMSIALIQTGGARSALFSGYMLLFFLALACIFIKYRLSTIFIFAVLNALFLGFLTVCLIPKSAVTLNVVQVSSQSVLMLFSVFCVVVNFLNTTARVAEECERQSRHLTEVQNDLAHTGKMAEVGTLVATTAHELAQPLQVILTASSLLRRLDRQEGSKIDRGPLVERIVEASSRATRLLAQLRDFSRKDPFVLKTVDLADSIRAVYQLSHYNLQWRNIRLQMEVTGDSLRIRGDCQRLQQIFFNLINNAGDACSGVDAPLVSIKAFVYRNWVRVVIWNNGSEIPPTVQKKLFQPYFTTKVKGSGTGLGLTICQQLVEQQGGRILFSSQSGDTSFVMDFPRLLQSTGVSNGIAEVEHKESFV